METESTEEIKKSVDEIEEKRMVELLTAKGYRISKEKGLVSGPSKARTQALQNYNSDVIKDSTNKEESQDLELYTLGQIHQLFDYNIMLIDDSDLQRDIDSVMSILHTAMNTSKKTIRIAGEDKSAMAVIGKLMKLDKESILYAINKFSEQTERIKNPAAYMLTILYYAPEQYYLDIKNQVIQKHVKATKR